MGHHVRLMENAEADDEPRILLENPETDDEYRLALSDESGSDDEAIPDLQNVQLDETDRAILERLPSGPRKRAKTVSGDCHTAAPSYFGLPTLDGLFKSSHNEQETLATQAQVSGCRVTARRDPSRPPEKVVTSYQSYQMGYESPLFNSCFNVLFEMTGGAYREKCPDLMEFLAEELTQVQKRYKVLVKVGSDAGFESPTFQRAVEVWRNSLDMATDPSYQAEQAKNVWGAVSFEKTLERLRNPRPEEPEPTTTRKYKKRKYADPPLVDVYRRACERLTMQLLDGATCTQQPLLLLELLLEDFQHVHRRQQALFRAELAAASQPPVSQPSSLPEKEREPEWEPDDSPLYRSCFKLLGEMADGACREQCSDLGEYFCQELILVQNRQDVLIKAGSKTGYDSPSFQRAVVAWRKTLDQAAYLAKQAKKPWGALITFEQTLDRRRKPRPEEGDAEERSAHVKYKKATERKAGPLLGDNINRNVESVAICCEITMRLLHEATCKPRPEVLLELLLEDLQHVQRRQQALLQAEMATANNPPKQMVERVTCNDGLSSSDSILTAGGLPMGSESTNLMPQLVSNLVSSARSPFTTSQWVEFEHQALIFKYMVAGVRLMNVPNEILDPIRKSAVSTNETASHPAGPNLGFGTFHLGVANNTDPEPDRCRRTDGKKWRCAREVVRDQKYCERHMHRGRHRSSSAASRVASSGQIQLQASQ